MWSRRSLATPLLDGLSHVRRFTRLFWQFDEMRHTNQLLITAYNGNGHFFRLFLGNWLRWLARPIKAHDRSRPRHFRWMMVALEDWLVNLVVRRTKVFPKSEDLHEPFSGSNFVIFDVL